MGRDKPKKYNKMGYFQKQAYHDEQAKKYGINKDDFNTAQGGGGGRYDNIDDGAYQKAIKNAMRNDFDYRTSAQHMDDVKGKANFNDFNKYERGAVKLHRKAGNGGQYSSNEDITTVTNNLIRDKLKDSMSAKDQQKAAKKDSPEEPYQESDELSNARQTVEDYDSKDFNVLNRGNATGAADAGDGNVQRKNAAQTFLEKYKLDVKAKANFQPIL